MASLRELIIKISANSSSFQTEISRASRMGADYYKTMEQGNRRAEYATRQSQRALADLNGQLATVRQTAMGMAGVFAGAFATGHLINLADQWNQVNARLKQASQSSDDFSKSQQTLMAISQRTGTAFGDNASLFARSAVSMREFGYASDDVLKVTEAISTGLKLSGAGTQEASSVITQFSQALAQGVLRGEEFNSVNENGDRVIRALAAGMGVARKDLKAMADQGLLSIDKVVPALLSQLGTLQSEFAAMPSTVSGSITKVENAFQQWVGGVNETSGVTAALSSTLDGLAGNIDDVATALGVLVSIGAMRYFGGLVTSMGTATAGMMSAYRAEVAVAAAQVEGTKTATAAARATLYRAQQAKAAAVGIEQQIVAERQLAVAQSQLSASVGARSAAQTRLNSVTSLGARLGGSLLSVVGGIPGIVLGVGAAWMYVNEKNEQARKVALAYGDTVEQVKKQMSGMSLAGLQSTAVDASNSITAQRAEIAKTEEQIRKLKDSVSALTQMEAGAKESPWMSRINTLMTLEDIQQALIEAQGELSQKNYVLEQQTDKLRATEGLRTQVLNESISKTAALSGAVGSLAGMYAQLNRVTGLATSAALPAFPGMQLPKLDTKQQDAMTRAMRDQQLAGLKGIDKVRLSATFEADDLKLPPGRYEQYVAAKVGAEQQTEALTAATKAQQKAEQDAASAAKKSATVTGEYQQKIANLNKEIQVERVRLKEGDAAAALFSASLETGSKWTGAQRAELERLNKTLTEAKQRWDDHNAAIASDPYRQASQTRKESEDQLQRQIAGNEIKSAEELARRKQEINTTYLNAIAEANQRNAVTGNQELAGNVDPLQNIENQLAKRQALIETYATAGVISEQRKNQLILASENETNEQRYQAAMALYSSQGDMQKLAVDLFQSSQERVTNMLTGMLTGTQTFKESMLNLFSTLTQSIIKNLVDMAAQALITSTIMQTITGIFGGVAGGAAGGASAAAGSTGAMGMSTSYMAYAKGGVVASSDLSQFSGQVVSSPTMFAFAKGAGLMGEAGPEAIMPLTRAADGSLGVRAISQGGVGGGGGGAPQVYININSNGQASQTATTPGWEQFGSEIGQFVDQRYRALRDKDLGQNGVLTQRLGGRR
ncbi:exopolyphosphatase [Serratia plymuthica A30]|uniref:tape measure protein n=1 Tax=Serratia plymuthica TaxID=82996 RepID=UPI0002A368DE|nr:tape measure protein [Serratia plymuthica]EKF63504.1 exopolyphosphatase [Serratia plymuthica A30]